MKQNCKYHPKQGAAWFCPHCDTLFCNSCVPEDNQNYYPKCSLCRKSLQSLSIAERIPPFWQKLPDLLGRPISPGIILLVFLYAAILAFMPHNNIGLVLSLLTIIPVIEMIFDVMERTASGDKLARSIRENINFNVQSQSFKLLIGFAFISIVLVKIYVNNPFLSGILAVFFILGIPASIIILMMEKSVLAMFNPLKIIFIIKQFKAAYFILYAIMLSVSWLSVNFVSNSISGSAQFFNLFLGYALIFYLLMTLSVLAGYLVYQYHHELNFVINRRSLHQSDLAETRDDMAEVNIYIQEGRFEDAQKLLLERINRNPADYRASEKLILLYAVQGNESYVARITNQYFNEMVQRGKQKQAVDFFQKLHSRSIEFIPESMEVIVAMVGEMKNKLQFKIALELIEKFLAGNKFAEGWEKLFLHKAQLLIEFANRSQDAIEVLQTIINRSINQEIMQQAEDYLQAIK